MSRVLLLRHGRTEANDRRLYCGSTDLPLSEGGRAALLALKAAGGYPPLEGFRVVTSGMKRTEETLSLLYGETPHEREPDLREMDFGAFEMRGYEELKDDPSYRAWCSGDNMDNTAPGGESGRAMAERAAACFSRLRCEGRDLCIVTHGGVIAAIMASLFPEENKSLYQWQPENGKGYLIELDGEKKRTDVPGEGGAMKKKEERADWEGKGYSFFQNTQCEYFPCHRTKKPEDFNCLFCYCPLYALGEDCGGNFYYSEKGVKVCTNCLFPHVRANYGKVVAKYPLIARIAAKKEKEEPPAED